MVTYTIGEKLARVNRKKSPFLGFTKKGVWGVLRRLRRLGTPQLLS
jgi:hypothetical protein